MNNKEKLLSLIDNILTNKITYTTFSSEFDSCYWADGVHETLEEVDNEFFYRVYECSTYVDNEHAGKWGLESVEGYMNWLNKSTKEFLDNKDTWYERVKSEPDMWA